MRGSSDENTADFGCPVEMGRALQKISHVHQIYKDSLVDLREAEEMMEREGPRDEVLLQVARTMLEAMGKLMADVGAVPGMQDRLELVQAASTQVLSFQNKDLQFGADAKEKRKAVSRGVVRADVRGKRRAALKPVRADVRGKRRAASKPVVGADVRGKRRAASKPVVGADVRGKKRAVSKGGIVYGHVSGDHPEVMNPFLWRKLPSPLLELVFDRVISRINDSTQCQSTRLPDPLPPNKVSRLIYKRSGHALLALGSNAVHKLWKWQKSYQNPSGTATASFPPELWQPDRGVIMTNDISDANPEKAVHCCAISKNDSYVVSTSGGKVSLFNIITFKVMTTCMPPPPAVTFLVFYPQDNNIIAIGMEDSTIQIYNLRIDEVMANLKGHQKRITGLAFSSTLNVLVSSGSDSQLCLWNTDTWEKYFTQFVRVQPGGSSQSMGDIHVQFHIDQVRLLVVQESQLAVYDAAELDYLLQWVPQSPFWAPLSTATYSCDSQLVFAGFVDGSVAVFDAGTLQPRCRLAPSVHTPQGVGGFTVYPLVIAAHPREPNQFALGLSDGGVQVIEPLESEGKWGMLTVLPLLAP